MIVVLVLASSALFEELEWAQKRGERA